MSIDFQSETLIDAARQGPEHLPPSRNGRPVHSSFLIRAITKGINGVRLEAVRVGSRWITSVEALQRWAERQTSAYLSGEQPTKRSVAQRQRAAERADRELRRRGC